MQPGLKVKIEVCVAGLSRVHYCILILCPASALLGRQPKVRALPQTETQKNAPMRLNVITESGLNRLGLLFHVSFTSLFHTSLSVSLSCSSLFLFLPR